MALAAGTRLGPYEIIAPIGAGGMGEVYRARDTTLHRDVALKVLPDLVSSDPKRLARFDREAQLLAAVNHPHIGSIYGVVEAGGVRGLILELVDGPTLAALIADGALPRSRRWRSPCRSRKHSKPPTIAASSIATSNQRTSKSGTTAR